MWRLAKSGVFYVGFLLFLVTGGASLFGTGTDLCPDDANLCINGSNEPYCLDDEPGGGEKRGGNKPGGGDKPAQAVESSPKIKGSWAMETLKSMTLDEKIGQLFMLAAYSNKDAGHENTIEKYVREEGLGGLIFMQGGPARQIKLIKRYQAAAKVPLMIAQDSEWGLSMRLDSTLRFPRNMTLGAISDDSLLFTYGYELGRQCRAVGVHVNFAPVVDVNNNSENPVINDRSFGENRENVSRKSIMLMQGMHAAGVIACAKHFPGHGDTDIDSHKDLPVILHDRARLDSIELFPFRQMIQAGVPSVMVAHLYIPSLDDTPNQASTLSPKIINDLLVEEMGFKGLIFTDALNMQGVAKYYSPGEVDLKALLAGNDILLFSQDITKAREKIKAAIEKGNITEQEIDEHVFKILMAKEWLNLPAEFAKKGVKTDGNPSTVGLNAGKGVGYNINGLPAKMLKQKLYEAAITVPINQNRVLPLQNLDKRKIAYVQIGGRDPSPFLETLQKYSSVEGFFLPSVPDLSARKMVLEAMKGYNTLIVGLGDMNKYASRGFGISSTAREMIGDLRSQDSELILTVFGSPYSLKYFGEENAIVVAYEDDPDAQIAAAEAIFGGIVPTGALPVSASGSLREGMGKSYRQADRIAFGIPEQMGLDSRILNRIDSIALAAIKMEATPGCAILVMRGNRIVYDKAFGNTVYKGGKPVDPMGTIYDLASVTKVTATTMATMRLVHEGAIDLEKSVSDYLPGLEMTDKAGIKVKNLLMHNAGLRSWIPFYLDTYDSLDRRKLDTTIYSKIPTEKYCVPITDGLYMCRDWQDSIWIKVINSGLPNGNKVVYSDLGLIMMGKIVETVTHTSLDRYVDSLFYQPLGMNNTFFNPGLCNQGNLCAPTELDDKWRKNVVQGFVHDQASAMLGGVSGHAGLFSNVYDLAKLLMMVNNGGWYGGEKYLDGKTIRQFTAKQLDNSRKGLGWDKPQDDTAKSNPASDFASSNAFGHTGFTGTCVWVDPDYDLVYIFLSNRTFPNANNRKLITEGTRTKIMDVIYQSMMSFNSTYGSKK